MIKVGLCGVGKTGLIIKQTLLALSDEFYLTGEFTSKNGIEQLELLCKNSDVIIDFSRPDILPPLLNYCKQYHTKLVSGTTGLSESDFALLQQFSQNIAIFYSANFSSGAHLVTKAAINIALAFGIDQNCDIIISDSHHRAKKDSPSGTALVIAQKIKDNLPWEQKIDFVSIRAGNNYGEHEIMFVSDDEKITLKHQALNRDIFAKGAIKAARWIMDKPAGVYSMNNLH